MLYLACLFFQGGAGGGITGFVNNMRTWLWIPVSQVCVCCVAFFVLHDLPLAVAIFASNRMPLTPAKPFADTFLLPQTRNFQDAYRRVNMVVFSHVLDLDL